MTSAEDIFLTARDLPPTERPGYLDRACGRDAELRAKVEALLASAAAADEFFGESPAAPGETLRLRTEDLIPSDEREGMVIGRYKLLQRIGEGGMGVVYMAEQEHPVRRRVALKIIKLGMDTKAVVARFEAERQALAMMDHPNIARVLDAGTTDSGRPYFVMELVQGIPITEFCDSNKLNIRERLELFIPVCKAIQSAHQKGIIHRDLKPSNVMVTLHHGDPMPKVIDFGVAKATSQRLTEKTLFTHYGTMIGTPAYMSPEQAQMSSLDVDTRTDVYSLGVLLYELLTGSTPFPQERLHSLGLGQIQRVLAEEEPETPSTRVSTMLHEKRTIMAHQRGLTAGQLGVGIPGDLDWIVMKCLEKDRRRRYDTVNGLAMDITRHLADETVLARPPSPAYRLQKAFRRHRTAFLGLTAFVLALAVGLGISTWQAIRARRAEALAQERREDAESVARFLTEIFQSPDPRRSGYSFTVAEALGRAVDRLEKDLANQPERRTQLQATLANTYTAIGLHREAIPLREQVLRARRQQLGLSHDLTLQAMYDLARSLLDAERVEDALAKSRELLAIREQLNGPNSFATLAAAEAVATACSLIGRHDEAEALMTRVLTARARVLGPDHAETLQTRAGLAVQFERAGKAAEALRIHEEVLQARRKTLGPEHPETLTGIANLAANYYYRGRTEEALRLQHELIEARRKVLGPSHPETLMAMHYLAYFNEQRHPEEAIRLHREVAGLRRKHLGPTNPDTILSLHYLALAAQRAGRFDEALATREEVVRLRRQAEGIEHPHTVDAMTRLAASYLRAGRSVEAIGLLRECAPHLSQDSWLSLRVLTLLAWFEQENSYIQGTKRVLAMIDHEAHPSRISDAVQALCLRPTSDMTLLDAGLRHARRSLEAAKSPSHRQSANLALGMALFRSGRFTEAEAALRAGTPSSGENPAIATSIGSFLSLSLERQGRTAEAQQVLQSIASILRPMPVSGDFSGDSEEARWMLAWIAHREARQALTPTNSARATDSSR